MDDTPAAGELVERVRAGDPRAAEELFVRYARRLTRLAEEHLSRKLAARLDGEDVVQSVFRTFFQRTARGEFRIDSSSQLWRLLVKITVLKARAQGRRHAADKRDVGAEAAAGGDAWLQEALTREPGPEEAAALVDQVEHLLRGLPALYCHVLEMRLEGHSVADVAARHGVSRQTVYRALELLQRRYAEAANFSSESAPGV
jgi:RNA polymerase sigma-70 factor (ECF subfamily)